MAEAVDAARLALILTDLRLPAIKQGWSAFATRADKEGWPAARFLAALAEHEVAQRDHRRVERHLNDARLLPGKTLDAFGFDAPPMISKAHVMALCAGDSWLERGANLILIGGPGGGKSHLASAIGLALIENGWRVLFARTSDLVQKLQVARRELALEAAIARLDRFHLLILGRPRLHPQGPGRDLRTLRADQRSIRTPLHPHHRQPAVRRMGQGLPRPRHDPRGRRPPRPPRHHATIFEMNVDSYRRRTALQRKQQGAGRPATFATIKNVGPLSPSDNQPPT